jgi:hypothetical protein
MRGDHAFADARAARAAAKAYDLSPRKMTEDAIHRAVVEHLTLRVKPGVVWWHTPNGGKRSAGEAGKMKPLGQQAGMPDLMLLSRGVLYALELKAKAGRMSPAQKDRLPAMAAAGAQVAVAYSLDEALEALTRWGVLR